MNDREQFLTDFLGLPVGGLLSALPFSAWEVTRSTEVNLPEMEIWYEFERHGVQVICNEDERVRTIFLHQGDGEALVAVPFPMTREEVLGHYGTPSKSGDAVRLPVLGDRGAWDRFSRPGVVIHVQYLVDRDAIDMVTFMRPDSVP